MKKKNLFGISMFLAPAVVLTVLFFIIPLVFLLVTSMTDWGVGSFDNTQFVGFDVYQKLFSDAEFWKTLVNNLIWIAVTILVHVPLALITAMILARKVRGWKFFRTAYFLPNVIAQFSLAIMWMFIFNPDMGVINEFLRMIGLESLAHAWLNESSTALGALIFTWIFNIGMFMVIFMTQISTIPKSLYEAAEVDGASIMKQELHITLPMIKGALAIVCLLSITTSFKSFDVPYVLTNGGPGVSSQILPIMMYKKFLTNQSNVANAVGVVMVILGIISILLINFLQRDRLAKRRRIRS